MTIPYNSGHENMKKFVKETLYFVRWDNKEKTSWYSNHEDAKENSLPLVNDHDISLLISCIRRIITNDFEQIKKLTKYLTNVAKVLTYLELPISWNLPPDLTVIQSYLLTTIATISPFLYSKIKINLKVSK